MLLSETQQLNRFRNFQLSEAKKRNEIYASQFSEIQDSSEILNIMKANQIIQSVVQQQAVQDLDFTASQFATLAKAGLFEEWTPNTPYIQGQRFVHQGVVYEAQQAVTAQAHQPPDSAGMLAVYRPISADPDSDVEPDGSRDNPIPFLNGMDVSTGLYYSFEDKVWLAKADMRPCVWNPGTVGMWQWEAVG